MQTFSICQAPLFLLAFIAAIWRYAGIPIGGKPRKFLWFG